MTELRRQTQNQQSDGESKQQSSFRDLWAADSWNIRPYIVGEELCVLYETGWSSSGSCYLFHMSLQMEIILYTDTRACDSDLLVETFFAVRSYERLHVSTTSDTFTSKQPKSFKWTCGFLWFELCWKHESTQLNKIYEKRTGHLRHLMPSLINK